jgi:tripartite-type tricarboxylate transporter receptor subunit TctC
MSISIMMKSRLTFAALVAAGVLAATPAAAQEFPAKPVRIIVPFAPGSATDAFARILGPRMTEMWGQPVVVENRPGAGSVVGTALAAKAPADGYTLLMALGTTFTVNPSLYKKPPFDPLADFRFIAITSTTSNTLVVHPSVPVNSVSDFVAYAKKQPMSYAHGGNGTPGHLCMEYFGLLAGFRGTPVPYRGNPQLVTDLVSGQIKFGFVSTSGVAQHVREGRLKGLAVSTRKRSLLTPDLPTIAEVGFPEFEFDTYHALAAPAAIPEPIALLLEGEVLRALALPDLQERLRVQDILIVPTPGAEARARIASDFQKWAKVVETTGMRID